MLDFFRSRILRVARTSVRHSLVCAIVLACAFAGAAAITGCLPKSVDPIAALQTQSQSPLYQTMQFVGTHEQLTWHFMYLLNFDAEDVIELDGAGNLDSALSYWREGRNQYEQIRFAVEQFVQPLHYLIAAWFTDNPTQGFHFMEKFLFTPSATLQSLPLVDYPAELIQSNLAEIPDVLTTFASDTGIFRGMLTMLADIDSLKLSGMDSAYSNNSFNDIFSNFTALDTVYGYYRKSVLLKSPAADSVLRADVQAARMALMQAGSLTTLDKTHFRTAYLYPLDSAVAKVEHILAVTVQ